MRKKLFVDLDGTLAKFYQVVDCLERMWNEGFFVSLDAYDAAVAAINKLGAEYDVDIYVVSAVNPGIKYSVQEEKTEWVRKHIRSLLSNVFFLNVGESKADCIKEAFGQFNKDFFLLDDYNTNLNEWRDAGGSAIKFVNEINDKGTSGPLWTGYRIRFDFSENRIVDELVRIMDL